jgi:hypothetical protein
MSLHRTRTAAEVAAMGNRSVAERLDAVRNELRSIQQETPSWGGAWYGIGRAVREVECAIQMWGEQQ